MAGSVVNSSAVFQINICGGLTVLCSEIRHYAKPQNVMGKLKNDNQETK
jgi:hypothetical protein